MKAKKAAAGEPSLILRGDIGTGWLGECTGPDAARNRRTVQIQRWGTAVCVCVFCLAMIAPAQPLPESHDAAPGFAWLLGGPHLIGIIFFLPAHILFFIGAAKCLAGSVRGVVFVSMLAVLAGGITSGFGVLDQFHKSTLLKYPAFPLWTLSLWLLLIVAVILDVRWTAEKRRADKK